MLTRDHAGHVEAELGFAPASIAAVILISVVGILLIEGCGPPS
jgi:hypothetical protein